MKMLFRLAPLFALLTSSSVGGFDVPATQRKGLGQATMLSRSQPATLVSVPSGGIANAELKFEAGYDRTFGLSELDSRYFAAAWRKRQIIIALGLVQFGDGDFYAERTARMMLSYGLGQLVFGASASYMAMDFGDRYRNLNDFSFGLGATMRLQPLYVSLVADRLNSPRFSETSLPRNPRYSLLAELEGHGSYSLVGRVTIEQTEKPQLAIGQYVSFSSRSALYWGLSTEPLMYSGGLEVSVERWTTEYATSYHPELGFTHSVSLHVRLQTKKTTRPDND
ncbi:MAG: hypothetical protein ACE5FH_00545 [Candidatus Zixiibacteriota bacterium]